VYFSQSCGGLTEDAKAVWHGARNEPYLRSHADPYCLRRSRDAWHAEVSLQALGTIAKAEGWRLPPGIVAAQVVERSSSHRALRVRFTGSNGASAVVAGNALRMAVGRSLGWNQVRSDAYELGLRHGALVFDGHGHGHGVGLCQLGATEMASEGKSAREILGFYFPGTAVRVTPEDSGWREMQAGAVTVRATQTISAARQAEIAQTWAQAQQRFTPHRAVKPTLLLAPTTELFRQLTGQPGWMLASTQGSVIVLQPEAVRRGNRAEFAPTLLHEMLHAEVEAECGARTPLWLREGLVEVLAEDRAAAAEPMPTQAIEAELLHPSSRAENERAHRAAAAKVRGLIARYGTSSVRGWLSSGVPTGVA
jgi:stage II sporulation protein D